MILEPPPSTAMAQVGGYQEMVGALQGAAIADMLYGCPMGRAGQAPEPRFGPPRPQAAVRVARPRQVGAFHPSAAYLPASEVLGPAPAAVEEEAVDLVVPRDVRGGSSPVVHASLRRLPQKADLKAFLAVQNP